MVSIGCRWLVKLVVVVVVVFLTILPPIIPRGSLIIMSRYHYYRGAGGSVHLSTDRALHRRAPTVSSCSGYTMTPSKISKLNTI